MALDRMNIEKRDFPIGRRGYEPEAVDAHLAVIAVEVEALKRQVDSAAAGVPPAQTGSVAAAPVSLAAMASEQVRTIVEAAEHSAADIERQAQQEAARISSDAANEAEQTRQDAVARSQEHVAKVSEGTALMLQRVDAMEGELNALVESLRTGAARLTADLALLHGNMGELYGAASPVAPEPAYAAEPVYAAEPTPETPAWSAEPVAEVPVEAPAYVEEPAPEAPVWNPEPAAEAAPETPVWSPEPAAEPAVSSWETTATPEAAAEPAASDWGNSAPAQEAVQTSGFTEPAPDAPAPEISIDPPPAAVAGADVEGARLIALNMALNGQSREETDRYLAENFDLADRATLLDEVYATLDG